jgi:hypothetical protein
MDLSNQKIRLSTNMNGWAIIKNLYGKMNYFYQ